MKDFLLLANNNAITYKEFNPLIQSGKVKIGRTLFVGKMPYFKVPDDYTLENERFIQMEDGLYKQVNGVCWYTTLETGRNNEYLTLTKTYNEEDYPKYENYDGINVDRVNNIPKDFYGVIGVPITFLSKHNPNQFELVRFGYGDDNKYLKVNGKTPYYRILIRRKQK